MIENKDDSLLRVENLDKNEYIVTSSVVDVPEPKQEEKHKKVGIFTVLMSALSPKMIKDEFYDLVRPTTTLKLSIMSLIVAALLYIFYKFTDPKIILPITILFCIFVFPTIILSLFYEICPEKKVSGFQIIVSFILGILLYALISTLVVSLIKAFANALLVRSVYETIIIPIMWGIGELLFVAILSKIFNITDQLSGILIAVSIGLGYAFSQVLVETVSSLFFPVEGLVLGDIKLNQVNVIIDNIDMIGQSFSNMFTKVGWHFIYYPVMIGCWSVVIGNVISVKYSSLNNKKDRPFSVYLLVVLIIALYMLSVFSTSFVTFDILIKIVATFLSVYISAKLINNALERSASLFRGDIQ